MLAEIVRRTPAWVFIVFFGLLALGYQQSKDRQVPRRTVWILPLAMLGLSWYGVLSAFGMSPLSLPLWLAGAALAVALARRRRTPRGVAYCAATRSYALPGSWQPLALMMAIFFTRYAVGVVLARRLAVAGEPAFVATLSFCYGLFSGTFLGRATVIWQSAAPAPAPAPAQGAAGRAAGA